MVFGTLRDDGLDQPKASLALDQHPERAEWRDWHQLVRHQVGCHQRQCTQLRSCLLDRFDVHQEDRPSFFTEPELLDSAIKIVLKRGWHLLRHNLLQPSWGDRLNE
jgi:hypothetical protein